MRNQNGKSKSLTCESFHGSRGTTACSPIMCVDKQHWLCVDFLQSVWQRWLHLWLAWLIGSWSTRTHTHKSQFTIRRVINNCRKWPTSHAHRAHTQNTEEERERESDSNSFLQCKSKCRRLREIEMKHAFGLCQSLLLPACPAVRLSCCPVCLPAVTVYCNKRNLCHELLLRRLPKRKCERSQNKWRNKAKRRRRRWQWRRDLWETFAAS